MRSRRNRRINRPRSAPARNSPGSASIWALLVHNHFKIWVAAICGIAIGLMLPAHGLMVRTLWGWNAAILVLLPLTFARMRGLDAGQLREHYKDEDPTAAVILIVVIIGALLSVMAIIALLSTAKQAAPGLRFGHLLLATLTIVNSWLVVHAMYSLHYADMYYSVGEDELPPLTFPHTPQPLFWDFVYFAFTIGVACQTADVGTTQTQVRKAVAVHSVIAFVFNLFVLGFAINVSAGLVGGN